MNKKPEDMSVVELCEEGKVARILRDLGMTDRHFASLYLATIRFELAKRGKTPDKP